MLIALLIAASIQETTASSAPIAVPPAYAYAAQAFGRCIGDASNAAAIDVSPSSVARSAVKACAAQRTALDTQFAAWVDGPSYSAVGRDEAHRHYQANMAHLPADIANTITRRRHDRTNWTIPPAFF